MWLTTAVFFAYLIYSEADNNRTELEERLGSVRTQRNGCHSRRGELGRCMPLSSCVFLSQMVKQYNPMYVLQVVSDYTCGFGQAGVLVCCPETAKAQTNPKPQALSNTWGEPSRPPRPHSFTRWPQSMTTGFPSWNRPNGNGWSQPSTEKDTWNRPTNTWSQSSTESSIWNRPTNTWSQSSTESSIWNKPTNTWSQSSTESSIWNRPTNTWSQSSTESSIWNRPTNTWSQSSTESSIWNKPTPLSTLSVSNTKNNHRNRRLLPESDCGIEVANKILGGNKTQLEEYPWMALVRLRLGSGRTVFSCGGSLINSRYVLTAAHCIKNPRLPSSALIDQVRLGEYDQDEALDCTKGGQCSPPPDDVDVEERIVHPNYDMNSRSQTNDIALLRLKRPAKLSAYVQPICLPLDSIKDKNYDKEEMWTAGWGKTNNGQNSQSSIKLKVKLPIVPFQTCAPKYREKRLNLADTQLCAGGEANKDSCQGDSGGPLMSQDLVGPQLRWHVQGIVSIGPEKCGTEGSPGIYTKVSKYLDWIMDNIRE